MTKRQYINEITRLKKEKDAIILAHNYQLPEIQDTADYIGDSLGLAQKAASIQSRMIVLCGVYFMAETAAILNPGRDVIIPDASAGCPLSDCASADMVKEWRKLYPDYEFVAYVNTTAEVKALADICCTSANAVKIVRSLDNKKIVFLPDKNLGDYVKINVPEKEIVLWPGFCVVHENASIQAVLKTRDKHPNALIMAHPECRRELRNIADGICSTGQMFKFVEDHPENNEFIVVTEWGINYALRKKFPGKKFIEPNKRMECMNMKKITLEKLYQSLINEKAKVTVDPEIAKKARKSIERMLELTV